MRDIFAQALRLVYGVIDAALHDIADGNNADQVPVIKDGQVPEAPGAHRFHDMFNAVARRGMNDFGGHKCRGRHFKGFGPVPSHSPNNIALGKHAAHPATRIKNQHRANAFGRKDVNDAGHSLIRRYRHDSRALGFQDL